MVIVKGKTSASLHGLTVGWYSIRVSGKWLDDGGIGGEMVSGCFPKAVWT
jgi:hypothetical protein